MYHVFAYLHRQRRSSTLESLAQALQDCYGYLICQTPGALFCVVHVLR